MGGSTNEMLMQVFLLAAMFALLYLLMIRPQRKQQKALSKMRNSLDVGDEITTIGGIVGRVVSVKEDDIVIETGADKTKLRVAKWGVGTRTEKEKEEK